MRRRRKAGPVQVMDDGTFSLNLEDHEREILGSFVDQLRQLLTETDQSARTSRLFPAAYSADEEANAEWQRLMRDELVQSRVAAIDRVDALLDDQATFGEEDMTGLMTTVNSLRLVLGTILDIREDGQDENDDLDDDDPRAAQWHLYQWLGWLLEWIVDAQSPR